MSIDNLLLLIGISFYTCVIFIIPGLWAGFYWWRDYAFDMESNYDEIADFYRKITRIPDRDYWFGHFLLGGLLGWIVLIPLPFIFWYLPELPIGLALFAVITVGLRKTTLLKRALDKHVSDTNAHQ
jgi:hypothetical protein